MCGRFSLYHAEDDVIGRFEVGEADYEFAPRYNVAPSQSIAAVVREGEGRVLVGLKWGLVPSWAKDPAVGNRMINARAETLAEKPSYRRALASRRCLIPADGFYEWRKEARGLKQPMYIRRRDGGLFAFAGLWEEWKGPDGGLLRTSTIVTVAPNELMRPIHDRMPAILTPEDEARWLDPRSGAAAALPLLRPFPEGELEAFPVSRAVNSPSVNDPSLIESAGG